MCFIIDAEVIIIPASDSNTSSNIKANITFHQECAEAPLKIKGQIENLPPGLHGFHIHEHPTHTNCTAAGAHFNPVNRSHGSQISKERHVGDLGNIHANDDGLAVIDITMLRGL